MDQIPSNIPFVKKSTIVIILLLIIAISFEASQQLYYINRFDLAKGTTFWDVLKNQAYRWAIWAVLGTALFPFVKKSVFRSTYTIGSYIYHAIFIIGLVLLNIILISGFQMLSNKDPFSIQLFFNEYFSFFTFQKAPIYTLGYSAIIIILHYYFTNGQLQIKVQELSEIKNTHVKLYEKLKKTINDTAKVIHIKIGNNRRIIPVSQICWIEADDYCVRIHTKKKESLTMRSSLKSLEGQLGAYFIRVHRKAIVNMNFVKEVKHSFPYQITLTNQDKIPVAKNKLIMIKRFFE